MQSRSTELYPASQCAASPMAGRWKCRSDGNPGSMHRLLPATPPECLSKLLRAELPAPAFVAARKEFAYLAKLRAVPLHAELQRRFTKAACTLPCAVHSQQSGIAQIHIGAQRLPSAARPRHFPTPARGRNRHWSGRRVFFRPILEIDSAGAGFNVGKSSARLRLGFCSGRQWRPRRALQQGFPGSSAHSLHAPGSGWVR